MKSQTPLKDRFFCKKTTGHVVGVKVRHVKSDPKKIHRVLSSGWVVPKTRKTWPSKKEAKKHCKSFKTIKDSAKILRRRN